MKGISIEKLPETITITVHRNDIRNVQITNADRIRNMTDEELATFLAEFGDCPYPPVTVD